MAQWSSSDTGILRKNRPTENLDELLVFGYACKLFRDDEKAQYIDQGKHLIPWMGDDKLKIDRYDCRGALSILNQYEASREGYDATRWLGLSDTERKLEELCDKERYYSLEINEEEEEMYKEEEQKRQKTNEFQYSYDVPRDPDSLEEVPTVPEKEEEDEKYVPLPILDVPVDIQIPQTVKEYTRIEKTAMFVCKQGPQMEILIKAKQGDNPQFGFLTQGDSLYKFYRHVLAAFKNGRYQPQYDIKKSEEKQDVSHEQDHTGDYLHPSLISNILKSEQITSTVASVPYRPSANCAYSQLVNRIQGNNSSVQEQVVAAPLAASYGGGLPQNYGQMTAEQQQYYMYYYVQQYYEYYKHIVMQAPNDSAQSAKLPEHFQQLDNNMQNYIQQLAFAQYMHQQPQHSTSTSYAQIVSNLNKESVNPYAANMPQLPTESKEFSQDMVKIEKILEPNKDVKQSKVAAPAVKKPLLSLAAAYGSDSDSESEESGSENDDKTSPHVVGGEAYKVPTGDTQVVIDKMAAYVAKNGEQFEEIVKAKADTRFDFLNDTHEFNKYYKSKIKYLKKGDKSTVDEAVEEKKDEEKTKKKPVKPKKVIAPVCFSIKKAKEEQPKEIKSALPVEDSDEEENVENSENSENIPLTPASTSTNKSAVQSNKSESTTSSSIVVANDTQSKGPTNGTSDQIENQHESAKSDSPIGRVNELLDLDDPILEMMTLTGTDVIKDAKRAEDKIKDKLATAAREKLASVARDKALQLERKRKAAAFLKLKSAESNSTVPLVPEKVTNVIQKSPGSRQKSPRSDSSAKSESSSSILLVPEKVTNIIQKSPRSSQKSPKSESSASSRRSSVEVIFEEKPIINVNEDLPTKERNKSKERKNRERLLAHKEKHNIKRRDKKRRGSLEEEEISNKDDSKKKKEDRDKSHKKKKSHKRKRSKSRQDSKSSRKKSKKHSRKSESVSTSDGSE